MVKCEAGVEWVEWMGVDGVGGSKWQRVEWEVECGVGGRGWSGSEGLKECGMVKCGVVEWCNGWEGRGVLS